MAYLFGMIPPLHQGRLRLPMVKLEAEYRVMAELKRLHQATQHPEIEWITLTRDMLERGAAVSGGGYVWASPWGAFPVRFGRRFEVVTRMELTQARHHTIEVVVRRPVKTGDFLGAGGMAGAVHRERIDLEKIAYTMRSRKNPDWNATAAYPMAEGPGNVLHYIPGDLFWSNPRNQAETRWLERAVRRLERIKPTTIWRRWKREQPKGEAH